MKPPELRAILAEVFVPTPKDTPAFRRLAESPYLPIRRDRIATRAYFHAQNRTGAAWQDANSNWLQAELEEIALVAQHFAIAPKGEGLRNQKPLDFERAYRRVAGHRHVFGIENVRPSVVGASTPRRCALCGLEAPAARFKKVSHLIPDAFGNRSIRSGEECDACNTRYGTALESELAAMMFSERALSRVPIKKGGTAKAKVGEHHGSIGGGATGGSLIVQTIEGDATVGIESFSGTRLVLRVPSAQYRPISALRSLAKSTYLAVPADVRPQFSLARDMAIGALSLPSHDYYRLFIPGPAYPYVDLTVWVRELDDPTLPTFVSALTFGSYGLLWFAPDAAGRYVEPLMPTLLRSPYPPHHATLTRLTATSDEPVKAKGSTIELGFNFSSLTYSATPINVELRAAVTGSQVLTGSLTTDEANRDAADAPKKYHLTAAEGALVLDLTVAGAQLTLEHKLALRGRPVAQARDALRMVKETQQYGFEIIERGQSAPLLAGMPPPGAPGFAHQELLDLAVRLTLISERTGAALDFPAVPLPLAERLAIEGAYAAVTLGVVEYPHLDDEEVDVRVPDNELEAMLQHLASSPVELRIAVEQSDHDRLLGQPVPLGPCELVLERPQLVEAAPASGGASMLKVRADRVRALFENFKPGGTG